MSDEDCYVTLTVAWLIKHYSITRDISPEVAKDLVALKDTMGLTLEEHILWEGCQAYSLGPHDAYERCSRISESPSQFCRRHHRITNPYGGFIFRDIDNTKIYVMTAPGILKIGRSIDPVERVFQVRSDVAKTGVPIDRRKLVLSAWIFETSAVKESTVHKALGYRDRIEGEWWTDTPRVRGVLNGFDLNW